MKPDTQWTQEESEFDTAISGFAGEFWSPEFCAICLKTMIRKYFKTILKHLLTVEMNPVKGKCSEIKQTLNPHVCPF